MKEKEITPNFAGEIISTTQQSSVKITKSSVGFGYEVKCYADGIEEARENALAEVKKLSDAVAKLNEKYGVRKKSK